MIAVLEAVSRCTFGGCEGGENGRGERKREDGGYIIEAGHTREDERKTSNTVTARTSERMRCETEENPPRKAKEI